MPGPPPKPTSQRRRRNRAAGSKRLPAVPAKRKAPAFPLKTAAAATRTWWRIIWASPVSTAWLDVDVAGPLHRLCVLTDLVHRAAQPKRGEPRVDLTSSLLSEMRQLEDRLGLSPMSRRRLEWEVGGDAGSEQAPVQPSTSEDDGRWLRAVK